MSITQIIPMLITKLNKPRLIIRKGMVIIFRTGLRKKFIKPKIRPIQANVSQELVISTPGTNSEASHIPIIPRIIFKMSLLNIIDRKRLWMEKKLGVTIGSTAISDVYQPALFNFSCAQLINFINVQGTDATEIKLDVCTVKKGKGGGSLASADFFEKQGLQELDDVKSRLSKYSSYRVWT